MGRFLAGERGEDRYGWTKQVDRGDAPAVELAANLAAQDTVSERVEHRGRTLRVEVLVEVVTNGLDIGDVRKALDLHRILAELGGGSKNDRVGGLAARVRQNVDLRDLVVKQIVVDVKLIHRDTPIDESRVVSGPTPRPRGRRTDRSILLLAGKRAHVSYAGENACEAVKKAETVLPYIIMLVHDQHIVEESVDGLFECRKSAAGGIEILLSEGGGHLLLPFFTSGKKGELGIAEDTYSTKGEVA